MPIPTSQREFERGSRYRADAETLVQGAPARPTMACEHYQAGGW
jgi:hypothetical protein